MIDIHHLKAFVQVADKKSFTEAAEAMYLTQPTISSHIKNLEKILGTVLFDRLPQGVELTQAGQILYRYSKEILVLHRKAMESIQEHCGTLKGTIQVGGSTIPGEYILPILLSDFRQGVPEVFVELYIADTKEITSLILDGHLELGLVGADPDHDTLESIPFSQDNLVLIVPPSHPLAIKKLKSVHLQDILTEPFWMREQGSGTRKTFVQALAKKGKQLSELNIIGELGSTEAVKQAVKMGYGIAVISALSVSDDLKDGRLRRLTISGIDLQRDFYLVRHRHRSLSPAARFFYDFLKESRKQEDMAVKPPEGKRQG